MVKSDVRIFVVLQGGRLSHALCMAIEDNAAGRQKDHIRFTIFCLTGYMIISQGILTKKSYEDCLHIAASLVYDCNLLVSWNFKHLVNIKTINGVRAVSNLAGYRNIDIVQPTLLVQEGDE